MREFEFTPAHVGRLCGLVARVQEGHDKMPYGCISTDIAIDEIEAAIAFWNAERDRRQLSLREMGELVHVRMKAREAEADNAT